MCDYIVEAMFILLREKDFENIRISEIADLAGVNRSTYYRHFHSRQDIARFYYQRLLERCFSAFLSAVLQRRTRDDPITRNISASFSGLLKKKKRSCSFWIGTTSLFFFLKS